MREPLVADPDFVLYHGDALETLAQLGDQTARAAVTSPPYLDARPEYASPSLETFEAIFDELGRVCTDLLIINAGRLWSQGRELRWWLPLLERAEAAGWDHLDTGIWVKPNANPIQGRVFTNAHEYVFVLGRPDATFNEDAIRTPHAAESLARMRRNYYANGGVKGKDRPNHRRDPEPNPLGARARSYFASFVGRDKGNDHPAPMPLDLAEWMVALASWPGDTIIDPFAGSATTALACRRLGRACIAIELDEHFAAIGARRLQQLSLLA